MPIDPRSIEPARTQIFACLPQRARAELSIAVDAGRTAEQRRNR